MKKQDPGHRVVVIERNRPYDTFGWGVVFSDQTLGNLVAADEPRPRGPSCRRFNHWDDIDVHFKGRTITLGRPWLLRHRPQAPAQYPASALRGARRQARVRDQRDRRRRRSPRSTGRSRHRERRRQQRRARTRYATPFVPDIDTAPLPLRLARHEEALRRVHVRVRGDGARLVPGAHLPVRRRHLHLHRRDAGGGLAARGSRPDEPGGRRSRFANSSSRRNSRGIRCCRNATHLRGSAIWIRFPRIVCERWVHWIDIERRASADRADGRCRAHGALFDRLGHEARAGRRDRARAHVARRTAPKGWIACCPSYEALRSARSAEAAERRAQLDGMVRERRPLHGIRGRAVRLFDADAQPAHSHENLRLRDAAVCRQVTKTSSQRTLTSRPADAAARHAIDSADADAVSRARRGAQEPDRRFTDGAVLGQRRHSRRLTISCILARAPWEAPDWCSRK